jgi:hypothetical protein
VCVYFGSDGFCTRHDCEDPGWDCAPVPGDSEATAACYAVSSPMADSHCILDCTGGLACPDGMVCQQDVAFAGGAPRDMCM